MRRTTRAVTAIATAGIVGTSLTGVATAEPESPDVRAQNPVYFVHGYGNAKDCADTWGNAVDHFIGDAGMAPGKLHLLGYYEGDYENGKASCADGVKYPDISNDGKNDGTTNTRIKHVAAAFAHQLDSHDGEKIDIVAHSMGGLVTRVALLGTAKGWEGFPTGGIDSLNVDDVVTLGTPHQGVSEPNKHDDTQWESMSGMHTTFMKTLHAPDNRLSEPWADDIDWSFVGSREDSTVKWDSAIDEEYAADHKYAYFGDQNLEVTHQTIRTLMAGDHHFNMRHTHTGEDPTDTTEGRSPVALAWRAITDKDR